MVSGQASGPLIVVRVVVARLGASEEVEVGEQAAVRMFEVHSCLGILMGHAIVLGPAEGAMIA